MLDQLILVVVVHRRFQEWDPYDLAEEDIKTRLAKIVKRIDSDRYVEII